MEKLEKKMKESMDSAVQMAEKMMEENPSMGMDEAIAKALTVLADKKNKSIEAKARKDMSVSRDRLRKLVQVAYDYQDLRIRTANRLSRKADGTDQDKDDAILPEQEIPQIIKVLERSQSMEKSIFDDIDREKVPYLHRVPFQGQGMRTGDECNPHFMHRYPQGRHRSEDYAVRRTQPRHGQRKEEGQGRKHRNHR